MQKVLNAAYSFAVQKHATESDFLKQNGFQLKNILNTTYVKWHINQLLTNISRPKKHWRHLKNNTENMVLWWRKKV